MREVRTEVTNQKGQRRDNCQETQRWNCRHTEARLLMNPQKERLYSDELDG